MTNFSPAGRLVHNALVECVKEHNAAVAQEEIILLNVQRFTKGYTQADLSKATSEVRRTAANLLSAAIRWGTINTDYVEAE